MLSFIISNAMIIINATIGVLPVTPQNLTADLDYQKIVAQAQVLSVGDVTQQVAHRDDIVATLAPIPKNAILRSQEAVQSLPASNSAIVNVSMKYVGMYWDCTALVEQSLRDLGYQVGDLAPMSFGPYGTVFYDPAQVQAGDIMMRPGHVTLYAGDEMSVQGGFGWGGVVYTSDSPSLYTTFVRVG